MNVDKFVMLRKQRALLRWKSRNENLAKLQASGLDFRVLAESGPASGIAWIKTPMGEACYRLATDKWNIPDTEAEGKGLQKLKEVTGL